MNYEEEECPGDDTHETQNAKDVESDDRNTQKTKKKVCWHWSSGKECKFGENCWYEHRDDDLSRRKEKCWNWSESGYCRYGNKCRFKHQGDLSVENKHRLQKKERPKRKCQNWVRWKQCKYGENCHFEHSAEEEKSNRKEICKYVEAGKRCPRGESECWYSHELQENDQEHKKQERLPKNEDPGIRGLHSLYSLMNQMKEQAMAINHLKEMIKNPRRGGRRCDEA